MSGKRNGMTSFTLNRGLELIRTICAFVRDLISVNSDRHTARIGRGPVDCCSVTLVAGIRARIEVIDLRDYPCLTVPAAHGVIN